MGEYILLTASFGDGPHAHSFIVIVVQLGCFFIMKSIKTLLLWTSFLYSAHSLHFKEHGLGVGHVSYYTLICPFGEGVISIIT